MKIYFQKIKEFFSADGGRDLYIILIIILVAIGSFGLGRLSKMEEEKEPIQIEYPKEIININPASLQASVTDSLQNFVASKNGTKYHFTWCAGAKQIKEENKIYFNTKEEAEQAGYTKAANCKGL